MEPILTEKDSLSLIESMINKAKNTFNESGTLYLIWGFTVLVCSLVQFFFLYFFQKDYSAVWMLTLLIAIYQVFYLSKREKTKRVATYTEEILGYVWICFAVCLMLVLFIMLYTQSYSLINTSILILYGIPTFLSGIILKVKPLIFGAIACWLLSLLSVFIDVQFHALLLSVAIILAWIIPGFYIRIHYLKTVQNGK